MNDVQFSELIEMVDESFTAETVEVCELADRKVAQYPLY